jgi:5'-deoxynucleotidase YfbR-like HD superfamily hydrolase
MVTRKCYIGLTSLPLSRRWDYHVGYAEPTAKSPLHRDIDLFGPAAFVITELDALKDKSEAYKIEEQFIISCGTLHPMGYNKGITGPCNNGQQRTVYEYGSPEGAKYAYFFVTAEGQQVLEELKENKQLDKFDKALHKHPKIKEQQRIHNELESTRRKHMQYESYMPQIDSYMKKIYSLDFIHRYPMVPRAHKESVASHSYFVAMYVLLLDDVYTFSLDRALRAAIVHDVLEAELGDISFSTKKQFPDLAKAIHSAEVQCLKLQPGKIKRAYNTLKHNTVERDIVKLADLLQVRQYATVEMSMGNKGYIEEVYFGSNQRIKELEEKLKPHRRLHGHSKRTIDKMTPNISTDEDEELN